MKRIALTLAAAAVLAGTAVAPSHADTGAPFISTNVRTCTTAPHTSPSASCVRTEVFQVGDWRRTRTRSIIFAGGSRVWRSPWSAWHATAVQ